MGLRGPQPKPDAVRNKYLARPATAVWVDLPPEGRTADVPMMPECPPFLGSWTLNDELLWHRIWTSPEAVMWDEVHHEPLERYLILSASMKTLGDMSAKVLTTLNQIEMAHGMTPAARQRLYWRIRYPDVDESPMMTNLASVSSIKNREELR